MEKRLGHAQHLLEVILFEESHSVETGSDVEGTLQQTLAHGTQKGCFVGEKPIFCSFDEPIESDILD